MKDCQESIKKRAIRRKYAWWEK